MKNQYEIRGDKTAIFVKRKGVTYECLISTNKLEKADSYPGTWYAHFNKHTNMTYVYGNAPQCKAKETKRGQIKFHRYIIDAPNHLLVDHINNDTLDNRDCNLSLATKSQNRQNSKGLDSNNKSGVRGVYWNKDNNKWRARIKIEGKQIEVGSFVDLEDARQAMDEARKKYMTYLSKIGKM